MSEIEIDVTKCQYYIEDNFCDSVGTVTLHCDKNKCYFKKMHQLKQENEELKEKLEKIKSYFETTNIEYSEHKVMFDFKFKEIIEGEEW